MSLMSSRWYRHFRKSSGARNSHGILIYLLERAKPILRKKKKKVNMPSTVEINSRVTLKSQDFFFRENYVGNTMEVT